MELIKRYIKENNLNNNNRKRYLVYTRSYLYAYLRFTYNLSLEKIGEFFNRDHATVINGLKIYDFFKDDKLYIELTDDVRKEFTLGVVKTDNAAGCLMFQILGQQDKIIEKIL
tara:strand:+ start:6303 stop:6641 length:339 start_codon:yes stop_codon:yes gene_type:complete